LQGVENKSLYMQEVMARFKGGPAPVYHASPAAHGGPAPSAAAAPIVNGEPIKLQNGGAHASSLD
jgi:hypothetical protein